MTTQTQLKDYDIILLIDKSGSMSEQGNHGKTKWEEAKEATEALARKACEFDDDGIDLILFANTTKIFTNITPEKVHQVFTENEPGGGTDTAKALHEAFKLHFDRASKPSIIAVITDGSPNDRKAVSDEIVKAANKIEKDEDLGVTFLQVGNDSGAHAFLKYLDDNLQSEGAKFDIVDTKTFDEMEGMTLADVLIGAVDD